MLVKGAPELKTKNKKSNTTEILGIWYSYIADEMPVRYDYLSNYQAA